MSEGLSTSPENMSPVERQAFNTFMHSIRRFPDPREENREPFYEEVGGALSLAEHARLEKLLRYSKWKD